MSMPARITAVPSLMQVVQNPGLLEGLPLDVLVDLQRQLGHVGVDLAGAIARSQARPATGTTEPEHVVLIDEAARMLATSEDTLYSKWKKLPFAFKDPLDNRIKFRVSGIKAYLAGRTRS
jgi:hypothetical protein